MEEFWGIEVKSGQPFDVNLGKGKILYLSQACLGEAKKETEEFVSLHITVADKKLLLATLHTERLPVQIFDLLFDKDFQISHDWEIGSVYFYGYKADQDQPTDGHDLCSVINDKDFDFEDDVEEELSLPAAIGKPEAKKGEKAVLGGMEDAIVSDIRPTQMQQTNISKD